MAAAEDFQLKALRLQPEQPQALYNMADIYYRAATSRAPSSWSPGLLEVAQPTPEVLWLGVRVERRLGDRNAEANYGIAVAAALPGFQGSARAEERKVRMTDPAVGGSPEPSFFESGISSVGAKLAAARQALDLSVADVARQIKLSVPQVEALEADDLSRLPKSPVIVKGFLRNYAKLVQLDPDALLGGTPSGPPPERSGSRVAPGRWRHRSMTRAGRGAGRSRRGSLPSPQSCWRSACTSIRTCWRFSA